MDDHETLRETIDVIDDDIREMCERLDERQIGSPAFDTLERRINIKHNLLLELRSRLDVLECNAARERAEIRLDYHYENDTIDLY